jgi:hypothetical protein
MILCFAISANLALADNQTGGLFVNELDVKVGSNTDSDLDNDTTINEKAKPGDIIEFTIELENTFEDDENCDKDNADDKNECEIEDIQIEVTIKEIDDGDDLDEDSGDKFEISESDTKTKTISFELPEKLKSGSYDVIITVEGENTGNSSGYLTEWELKLDVEKKKHDIQITKYELIPEKIECATISTTLDIELTNYGDKTEDDVIIEVLNSNLNIKERASNIEMGKDYDKDAQYEKSIQILFEEEFSVEGIYPLTINVYFDDDKLDDQKTIDLIIGECVVEEVEEPIIEEVVEGIVPTLDEEEIVEEKKENNINLNNLVIDNIGFNNTKPYLGLIAGLIILVGLFIIIIIIILIKK